MSAAKQAMADRLSKANRWKKKMDKRVRAREAQAEREDKKKERDQARW